jgi:hypothetical protein
VQPNESLPEIGPRRFAEIEHDQIVVENGPFHRRSAFVRKLEVKVGVTVTEHHAVEAVMIVEASEDGQLENIAIKGDHLF